MGALSTLRERVWVSGSSLAFCHRQDLPTRDALLRVGIGVLSAGPASRSRIEWVIRSFALEQARVLVRYRRAMEDGFAVHRRLSGALEKTGS